MRVFKKFELKTLDEVINHLHRNMEESDTNMIIKHDEIPNPFFPMQIRNSFGLWWKPDSFLNYSTRKQRILYKWFGIKPKSTVVSPIKPHLLQWFHDHGFYHADDMSSVIIDAFVAKVKNEPYDINTTYERIVKHWKKQGIVDMKKEFAPWA